MASIIENKKAESDSNIQKVAAFRQELYRFATDYNYANTTDILRKGETIYKGIIDKRFDGASQMAQFYSLLLQLAEPFRANDLLKINEIEKAPTNIQGIVTTILECFNDFPQRSYLPSLMEPKLEKVIDDVKKYNIPEKFFIIKIANLWLNEIRNIHNKPENYTAEIAIELSPTLELDEKEEVVENATETINLPILLHNHGLHSAKEIVLTIKITDGSGMIPPENSALVHWNHENNKSIPVELIKNETKIINIKVIRSTKCTIDISLKFKELTEREKTSKIREPIIYSSRIIDYKKIKQNPYILTTPIPEKLWDLLVYERNEILNELMDEIKKVKQKNNEGCFLALKGLRRTGKSTLLRHLCSEVYNVGVLPVEIDSLLWRIEWEKDENRGYPWKPNKFLIKVALAIIYNIRFRKNQFDEALEKQAKKISDIEDFQVLISQLLESIKIPILLVFDEADSLGELSWFKDDILFLCFKSLLEKKMKIIILFSYDIMSPFWNNISNNSKLLFKCVRTKLLSRNSTINLAVKPANLIFTPIAEEYLWRITGGYPALVQLICHYLLMNSDKQKGILNPVRASKLREVVQNIFNSKDAQQYIDYLDYLKYGFNSNEINLLITLISCKRIEFDTGFITPLYLTPDSPTIFATDELLHLYGERWQQDQNDLKTVQKEIRDAANGLVTKEIIEIVDNINRRVLRLRVGFFLLYDPYINNWGTKNE